MIHREYSNRSSPIQRVPHYLTDKKPLFKLMMTRLLPHTYHYVTGVLDDLILLLFPVWFQVYISVFSISWHGYMYHVTLYIDQQHPITVYRTVFWVCVVLVSSVIRCSCYYFLDRILLHHDFIMIIETIIGIFMFIHYFLNYTLSFL